MLLFRLPQKLARYTPDLYASVASRIDLFKAAIQNGEAAQLTLSSVDINSLWSTLYDEFSRISAKKRARLWIPYCEVRNDKVIDELILYPLWFLPGFNFEVVTEISYISKGKEHFQLSRRIRIGKLDIPEELSFRLKEESCLDKPGLIGFILGSEQYRRINIDLLHNPENSLQIIEEGREAKVELRTMLRNIDSIEVKDSLIVISSKGQALSS